MGFMVNGKEVDGAQLTRAPGQRRFGVMPAFTLEYGSVLQVNLGKPGFPFRHRLPPGFSSTHIGALGMQRAWIRAQAVHTHGQMLIAPSESRKFKNLVTSSVDNVPRTQAVVLGLSGRGPVTARPATAACAR